MLRCLIPSVAIAAFAGAWLYGAEQPVGAAQPPPAVGGQCSAAAELSASFGKPIDVSVILTPEPGQSYRHNLLTDAGQKSLRLQIRSSPSTSAAWRLEIRDPKLRLLASISAQDLRESEVGTYWTGRFDVPQVRAELIGARPGEQVRIDQAIIYNAAGDGQLFSIQGSQANWRPLHEQDKLELAKAGDSVGMMVASAMDEQFQLKSWCCSGIMVAKDLFLTNWHCGGSAGFSRAQYWDKSACRSTLIDLSWDAGTRNRQYRCQEVVHANESLDYALLRVTPTKGRGGDDIPVAPIAIEAAMPAAGSDLMIVHHPVCLPKRISLDSCKLISVGLDSWRPGEGNNLTKSDLSHTCDTDTGSSGAPIMTRNGRLIALHHLGFEFDQTCKPLKKENRGVSIAAILADLQLAAPTEYSRIAIQSH